MIEPSTINRGERSHEEVFLARYGQLRAWALRLTRGDAGRAEDLVHDTYVQFVLSRPELGLVRNLSGYLHGMLRNLNVSHLRRAAAPRGRLLSASDYDSAEVMLRTADPRDVISAQDELRLVCRYACLRKDSSKAGSVLIMRFIHGYYPREIARVMRVSREAVEERLRVARSEARQFAQDPASLRFIAGAQARNRVPAAMGFAQPPGELLRDLRRAVFASRTGGCLSGEQLAGFYGAGSEVGIDCAALAHVVSCRQCIDEVNKINALPLLSERYPTDTLGTEPRAKGGGGDGDGPTGTASEEQARRCRRRAGDVFEHHPRELRVSVNGRLVATQRIGAELNRQELRIDPGAGIDSVEVFSEQGVRLLLLAPAMWPADAEGGRAVWVELSDRRRLGASLRRDGPMVTLQITYRNPLAATSRVEQSYKVETEHVPSEVVGARGERGEESQRGRRHRFAGARWLAGLRRGSGHFMFWLRPGTITAGLAVLLVAAILFTRLYTPTVSAAELLRRATQAEESAASGGTGLVLHRTFFLEETRGGRRGGRRRVELWHGGESGIRLRRLYDEQNRLLAGEWTNSDGTSTVYRRDSRPEAGVPEPAMELLQAGEVWRLEPSAKMLAALGLRPEEFTSEEQSGFYLLSYEAPAGGEGLARAQLWLSRADLHASRITLVLNRGGEAVEYQLIQGGLERRRAETVPPAVYQLEPELLGPAKEAAPDGPAARVQGREGAPVAAPPAQPAVIASAELEVEVAYLLNRIKANLGEQVSMGRTTGGALRIDALVETEARKEAILHALAPVRNNPAAVVEVRTIKEASEKSPQAGKSGVTEREVSVRMGRIPADAELREYFAGRAADGGQVDEKINRFAARAMAHSRQALLHASALKRLAGRFTPDEVRALEGETEAKWLSMIREHAQAYRREVGALRLHLAAVFPAGGDAAPAEAATGASPARAADRLLELSHAQDGAVRSAFTISEVGGTAAAIKSPNFRRSLAASERLAATIQSAYEHSGL